MSKKRIAGNGLPQRLEYHLNPNGGTRSCYEYDNTRNEILNMPWPMASIARAGNTINAGHAGIDDGQFQLQSVQESTGAQLAFTKGWCFGAPIIPGDITMNDLYNIIPMNSPISTAEPAGEEIIAMLEENLERTFGCDPYDQMGGYVKHGLGLSTPCGCLPAPAERGKPLASGLHGARQGMSNAPESVPFMQWVIQTLAQQVHVSAKPTNAGFYLTGTQQSHKGTMLLIDVR